MNIIVFDTETIGKVNQDLLNVGYKIIDLNIQTAEVKVLCERDYLVRSLIDNEVYCINDDFVGMNKYLMYKGLLADGRIIKRNLKQIYITLMNDIKKHKVIFGYAYNCKFDLDKFKRHQPDGVVNPFDTIPVFDIWDYAVELICQTEDYKEWALANDQITESKRYISTSVEAVARYLYNNLDFIEDHTALSDVQHETEILVECVKRGADITRPMKSNHFIASGKELTEIIVVDGDETQITYKNKYSRNGKTYYKSQWVAADGIRRETEVMLNKKQLIGRILVLITIITLIATHIIIAADGMYYLYILFTPLTLILIVMAIDELIHPERYDWNQTEIKNIA